MATCEEMGLLIICIVYIYVEVIEQVGRTGCTVQHSTIQVGPVNTGRACTCFVLVSQVGRTGCILVLILCALCVSWMVVVGALLPVRASLPEGRKASVPATSAEQLQLASHAIAGKYKPSKSNTFLLESLWMIQDNQEIHDDVSTHNSPGQHYAKMKSARLLFVQNMQSLLFCV